MKKTEKRKAEDSPDKESQPGQSKPKYVIPRKQIIKTPKSRARSAETDNSKLPTISTGRDQERDPGRNRATKQEPLPHQRE